MKATKTQVYEYPEGKAACQDVLVRGGPTGLRVTAREWLTGSKAGTAEVRLISGDGRTAFFEEFEKVTCMPEEIEVHIERLLVKAAEVKSFTLRDADAFYNDLLKYLAVPSEQEQSRLGTIFAKHYKAILNRIPGRFEGNLIPYEHLALLVGFAIGFKVPEKTE